MQIKKKTSHTCIEYMISHLGFNKMINTVYIHVRLLLRLNHKCITGKCFSSYMFVSKLKFF